MAGLHNTLIGVVLLPLLFSAPLLAQESQSDADKLKQKIASRGRTLLKHVEPLYSEQLQQNGVKGSVTMSFNINIDGTVSDIKILNSTPSGTFDSAAIDALAQWQYAPLPHKLQGILTRFDFGEPDNH
ncbi:energy transducer TonB [Neptunicella marina]|uniref:Protein TonB n=1 Tax=Neptunicella marina TaxID=2125989 RepID=A0A8J6IV49_9ALTE|nr:energy transducer TonB [Neptunicella marina]MBC3766063.1 energy transducer TonB [Neptunicella marina]